MGSRIISLFLVLVIGLCFLVSAGEFAYKRIDENILEFKAGGETFIFDGRGVYNGLKVGKFTSYVLIPWWKNGIKQPYHLKVDKRGIQKIEILLSTENTRKVMITLPLCIHNEGQLQEGEERFATVSYELQLTLQIWKDIPAISTESIIINPSEEKCQFSFYWVSSPITKPTFYTTSIDNKIVTKVPPEGWINIPHGDYFFVHSEENVKEGLGVIGKCSIVIPGTCVDFFSGLKDAFPGAKTSPFKLIFVPVKNGYTQLKEIDDNIKVLESIEKSVIQSSEKIPFLTEVLFYTLTEFKTPPVIDGNLDDWVDITPIVLDEEENVTILGVYLWGGKEDLSAKLYLGYDKDNLYLACETRDNVYSQNYTGGDIWKGDCLQFAIDSLNNEGEILQDDDYEYGFALVSGEPYIHCWASPIRQNLQDISLVIKYKGEGKEITYTAPTASNIKASDHGLIYEAKIPFKYLSPFSPPGIFGFNFVIMDNDDYGLKQYLSWAGPKYGSWQNPSIYGKVIIGKEVSIASKPNDYSISFFLDKNYCISGEEIPIKIIFYSPEEKSVKLEISLSDENKNIVSKKTTFLELKEGLNPLTYTLETKEKELGNYEFIASIYDKEDKLLKSEKSSFLILTKEGVEKKISKLKENISLFESSIEEAETIGIDSSYPKVSLATIKLYIPWTEVEITHNNLFRANKNLDYLLSIYEQGISEIKEMIKEPQKRISIPKYDFTNLKIRDGFFYSGETPCFFFGPCTWGSMDEIISKKFVDLGYNLVGPYNGTRFDLSSVLPNADKIVVPDLSYLDKSLEIGLMVEPNLLCCRGFPKWAVEKYPEIKEGGHSAWFGGDEFGKICLEHPFVREVYEKWLRTIVPLLKDKPAFLSYVLTVEDSYDPRGPINEKLFQKYLEEKYKTIENLNKIWETNYKNFQEIFPPPEDINKVNNFVHFQDWCFFAQKTYYDFLNFEKEIIRDYDKKKMMYGGPHYCKGTYWQNSYRKGCDLELLCSLSDMCGFDGDQWFLSPKYACDYWTANFAYDLFHSFGPERTISDPEWHALSPGLINNLPPEEYDEKKYSDYLRTGMWQAYLRGVSDIRFWDYHPLGTWWYGKQAPGPYYTGFAAKPCTAYSMGRTSLEIRRLAEYLVKFPQDKTEVALLYSHYSIPSLPKFVSYHEEDIRSVYEGTYFLDKKITFISERQIEKGLLKNYKLIIIPSAKRVKEETYKNIERYVKEGGVILIIGSDSLCFNEYEKPRDISFLIQGKNIKIGEIDLILNNYGKGKVYYLSSLPTPEEIGQLVNTLMDEIGINRDIRVFTSDNKNIWGVESRTVKIDKNKYLTYLININKEDVKVSLKGKEQIKKIKNLINGEEINGSELSLSILDPLLLEIEIVK